MQDRPYSKVWLRRTEVNAGALRLHAAAHIFQVLPHNISYEITIAGGYIPPSPYVPRLHPERQLALVTSFDVWSLR